MPTQSAPHVHAGLIQFPRMKRLRRWLFNGFAAMSLLLFVATVALWVRSSWIGDEFSFRLASIRDKDGNTAVYGCQGYIQGGGIWIDYAIENFFPPDLAVKLRPAWSHEYVLPGRYLYASDILRWRWLAQMNRTSHSLVRLGRFGMEWMRVKWPLPSQRADTHLVVAVPLWSLSALFLIFPLAWDIGHRRRHRAICRVHAGRCPNCNYDLRATPDFCPECGAVPLIKEIPLPTAANPK
jgi:hypothetical protein